MLDSGADGLSMGAGTLIHTNGLITFTASGCDESRDRSPHIDLSHSMTPLAAAVISQGAVLNGAGVTMSLLAGTFTPASQSIQIGTGAPDELLGRSGDGGRLSPDNLGSLYVTNATHTAYIDVNGLSNTLTLDGGFLECGQSGVILKRRRCFSLIMAVRWFLHAAVSIGERSDHVTISDSTMSLTPSPKKDDVKQFHPRRDGRIRHKHAHPSPTAARSSSAMPLWALATMARSLDEVDLEPGLSR